MKKNGFTLIELLVVVLIIGILAGVAVPQYNHAVDKSRSLQVISLLTALNKAQQAYYMANGSYSNSFEELDIDMPSGGRMAYAGTDPHYFYSWGYCSLDARGHGVTACNTKYSFGWVIIRLVPPSSKLVCSYTEGTKSEAFCKNWGFQKDKDGLLVMKL